jgi:hypothetical protein
MKTCVRLSSLLPIKSRLLFVLILTLYSCLALGQHVNSANVKPRKSKGDKVKLVTWKSLTCDNTFDPYRLVDRITSFEVCEGRTYISVISLRIAALLLNLKSIYIVLSLMSIQKGVISVRPHHIVEL